MIKEVRACTQCGFADNMDIVKREDRNHSSDTIV